MELNSIFLIENGKATRLQTYIYEAEETTQNDLYERDDHIFSSYAKLNKNAFDIIKKNQVNKYLRENKSFFIKATFKAYDREQKEPISSWDTCFDLYISKNDIKSIKEFEKSNEYQKGKRDIIKYYVIETKKPLFYAKGTDLKLFKAFLDIPEIYRCKAKELKNNWQDSYNFWKGKDNERAESIKKAHLKAIEKGFNFFAFIPSEEKESYVFTASCGVVRTEKTKEYLKIEKLTQEFNAFLYKDNRITTAQMENILKHYNITKKRMTDND